MGAQGGPGRVGAAPDLLGAVRAALAAHLPAGAAVVVGVSGGADSVGLLHLTVRARPDLALVVGHVRHGLREDDRADVAATRTAAAAVGAAVVVLEVAVAAGDGPEDAARRARHAALRRLVVAHRAAGLLLGHTMDDQAETVLLRIARGTGPDGLAGMAVASRREGVLVLRPLLALRRAEVRAAVADQPTAEDPTNADPAQRRARARHEVLPALARLHPDGGDPVPLLARLADLARADAEALDDVASDVVLRRYGPALLVPRAGALHADHPAVHARVLRRAWARLPGGPTTPPSATVAAIADLPPGRSLDAPGGVRVTASARGWVLDPGGGRPPPGRTLDVGGAVDLPEVGLRLTCRLVAVPDPDAPRDPGSPPPTDRRPRTVVWLGDQPPVLDLDPPPWTLRLPDGPGPLRVAGRPASGARDARDVLQQAVPSGLRHLVPLLRDADGRLLAVGSHQLVPVPATGQVREVRAADIAGGAVGYPAEA